MNDTGGSDCAEGQFLDVKRITRIESSKEMFHERGHVGLHFRLHRLTERFQCIKNAIYTAWHFLTASQRLTSGSQITEKNRT